MKKQKDILPMSKKERQRYHLLKLVIEGSITLKEASTIMTLSYRQSKRLKKKFLEGGAKGIIHGNRGKRSSNKLSEEVREKILDESFAQLSFVTFLL